MRQRQRRQFFGFAAWRPPSTGPAACREASKRPHFGGLMTVVGREKFAQEALRSSAALWPASDAGRAAPRAYVLAREGGALLKPTPVTGLDARREAVKARRFGAGHPPVETGRIGVLLVN